MYIKTGLLLLLLTLQTIAVFAQNYPKQIDSLAKSNLWKLTPEQRVFFNQILKHRNSVNMPDRLDTMTFDYLFIEESFCVGDSAPVTTERYFLNADLKKEVSYKSGKAAEEDVVLPRFTYWNGLPQPIGYQYYSSSVMNMHFSNLYERYYTRDTLLKNYAGLKPIQQLSYDATRYDFGLSDTTALRRNKLEETIEQRLKKTYQIITVIDKSREKVTVSIQLPAEKPDVRVKFITQRYYDW